MSLVLSIFPGIDLLGRAFEEEDVALAWAASLVDGEGCISLAKGRQSHYKTLYYRVDVVVANTKRELLEPLLRIFGGRIDHHKRAGRRSDSFQWKTTGSAHSAGVLAQIRPWLIAKQRQSAVALSACSLLHRKGGRRGPMELATLEVLKQQMHCLNRRGRR